MVFIAYFLIMSGDDFSPPDVRSVTIAAPMGGETFEDRDSIFFYANLYLDAEALSSPVRDISGETPITVTLKLDAYSTVFSLYPEVNTKGCFFQDDKGKYFSLSANQARALLQRKECAYVYYDAGYTLPKLTFVTAGKEEAVLPEDYNWQYTNISGVPVTDTVSKKGSPSQLFSFYQSDGCTVRFSTEPTSYTLSFFNAEGATLDFNDFASLIFPRSTNFSARLDAKWETDENGRGGEAVYTFKLFYDLLPEISLSTGGAVTGDVVRADFRHLSQNEQVRLETQLATAPIKVWYEDDNAFALLPVDLSNESGVYTLNFTIGKAGAEDTVSQSFDLTVTKKSGEFSPATMNTLLYTKSRTPEWSAEYEALMRNWQNALPNHTTPLSASFRKPVERPALYDFASTLLVNSLPPDFLLHSIDYNVKAGDSVKSTERGVAVYAEESEIYGGMVVIDHGYGVLSHYYNLTNILKEKGDVIYKGEIIGNAGISGLTYTEGGKDIPSMRFAISVNGVFVNPEAFFKNGINFK